MLVAGEYGKVLRINTGESLVGVTALSLTITRTDNSTINRTDPDVAVGTSDVTAQVERRDGSLETKTFKANEYVTYTIQSGDLTVDGDYSFKLQADFGAGKRCITVTKTYEVKF